MADFPTISHAVSTSSTCSTAEHEKTTDVGVHLRELVSSSHDMQSQSTGNVVSPILIVAVIAFAASGILFGFDNNVISPILSLQPFVEKYQGIGPEGKYVFTARNLDLIVSVPLVGSIFGALSASSLNTRFGRKWTLVGSYSLSLGGVFLQLFAPNLAAFVVGRFWNTFIMGISMATTPLYLSEVVPASMRGRAVTTINIMMLIAGVLATIVVWSTHTMTTSASYKIPLAVQCAMPIILIPLTVFLPESPQWLMQQGRSDEARANLRKLRAKSYSENQVIEELRIIKMCLDNERQLSQNATFWHLFDRENLKRTITAGSLFSMNQVSGIILSTTFATVFLTQLGVAQPFTLTVISSCCTLFGTIIAPLIIDRTGRRTVALVGISILMVIDFIAGGLAFHADKRSSALTIAILSFLFNIVWASSIYALSQILPTEIATPKLKNHTMAYTIAWTQTTAVITTFAVPQLTSADAANLGAKTYLVFGSCMALVILFVYFYLPETMGRTTAEVDEMYDAGIPMRHWKKYETRTKAKGLHARENGLSMTVTTSGSV